MGWLISLFRLARAIAAWAWPKIRLLLVLAIAVSMAEFVALDAGLFFAADVMLYLEIMIGGWMIARLTPHMPGFAATLMLLPYRLFDTGAAAPPTDRTPTD